jgi:hypothetical protein
LPGNVLDVVAIAPEINVAAGERHVLPQCRFLGQVAFRPIIDGLTTDKDIGNTVRIPNLKNLRELPEGKTVGHRSGPFCHRSHHLGEVGDLPFGSVADERNLPLPRHSRTRTPLPDDGAALLGFLLFDFVMTQNFHDPESISQFPP